MLDYELGALSIRPLRRVIRKDATSALFILWIQILKPLLGLAWSIFRKIILLFKIYMENGIYRRIGKKWPDFLTTLVERGFDPLNFQRKMGRALRDSTLLHDKVDFKSLALVLCLVILVSLFGNNWFLGAIFIVFYFCVCALE